MSVLSQAILASLIRVEMQVQTRSYLSYFCSCSCARSKIACCAFKQES